MRKYKTSVFIFRRDLRLNDNIGLMNALKNSNIVIPIFIFTPEQLKNNEYKSNNCVQFMIESLQDLNDQLLKQKSRLFFFYASPHIAIENIIKKHNIDAVYVNMDFTPYAIKRDNSIGEICKKHKVEFNVCQDILLNNINSIKTDAGDVYTKFTPYFTKARTYKVQPVVDNKFVNYIGKKNSVNGEYKKDIHKLYQYSDGIINGGRSIGMDILNNIKLFKKYNTERNILNKSTTKLSAYIKFGCVSIREVYFCFKQKLGTQNDLVKQLYWRDFYYNVTYNYPHVLIKNNEKNFREKYNSIPWITYNNASNKDKIIWEKWCNGTTGYPIVDACMRELNSTGFMHNRGRLITSNFLTKLMMWHWEEGEKYFAQHLVDYDPILNNGNWQWSAGSGVDAQPYFRIFNPWSQGAKFDEDCNYIKKWVPELDGVDNEHIHNWFMYHKKEQYKNINYCKPMIDYNKSRTKCLDIFKKSLY